MTNELATKVNGNGGQEHQLDGKTLLSVVAGGDCAALTPEQKVMYYRARCEAAGLDYRAQPFQFINLNGKLTLYATKAATDQLSAAHGIVCEILSQITENGIRTVTVRAKSKDGRQTDEIGCVSVGNATGDQLCNIHMKTVTKAKRRAVLSICGLGMLDETELETIPSATAPPSHPKPRRKSEAPREEPKVEEAKLEPSAEELNGKLDAEAHEPGKVVPIDGTELVTILGVTSKPAKNGGTQYGVQCRLTDGMNPVGEPFYANTFSDTDADMARTLKAKNEAALIKRKPRDYQGKIYWDLLGIAPAVLAGNI